MPEAKTETSPKKPSRKLIATTALGLLLAGGGATGAWLAATPDHAGKPAPEKKSTKKPLFTTLEPFTVNLRDPRGERFAQIGVTLQFEDAEIEMTIKDRLPAVRNGILLLISGKEIDELLSPEGKHQLAQQIRVEAARAIGIDVPAFAAPAASGASAPRAPAVDNPIRAVLFSQFIVQ